MFFLCFSFLRQALLKNAACKKLLGVGAGGGGGSWEAFDIGSETTDKELAEQAAQQAAIEDAKTMCDYSIPAAGAQAAIAKTELKRAQLKFATFQEALRQLKVAEKERTAAEKEAEKQRKAAEKAAPRAPGHNTCAVCRKSFTTEKGLNIHRSAMGHR